MPKKPGFKPPARPRCEPPAHHNPTIWKDAPATDGRIRTVCKTCGGFVGYRPVCCRGLQGLAGDV